MQNRWEKVYSPVRYGPQSTHRDWVEIAVVCMTSQLERTPKLCTWYRYSEKALWKKPFCFSFPPENSRIKNRKSRCRYQNNLPAAHTVFLNYPCQKSYGRKIPASNYRYGRKIRLQVTTRYGRKIRLPVTTKTAGKSWQTAHKCYNFTHKGAVAQW